MSFFTNGAAVGEVETLDQLMANTSIKESVYDDYIEGALAAVAESVDNDNRLMMAIGIQESAYFAETGKEFVYTEGTLSSIWGKVKEIVMKIWNKVKELFKRFIAMFDRFFASDKSFVKKYKKRILMADTTDLEYEGYKFAKLGQIKIDPPSDIPSVRTSVASDKAETRSENVTKQVNLFRGKLVGKTTEVEASEFASELKDLYYGDKETLSGADINLTTQLSYIEDYSKTKKLAEDAKKVSDKAYKETIKTLEDAEKNIADGIGKEGTDSDANDAKRTALNNVSAAKDVFTQSSQAIATAVGVYLNALKDRNRQARAICVKAMVKGKKLNEESASFEYPAYGSNFLEQVKFI